MEKFPNNFEKSKPVEKNAQVNEAVLAEAAVKDEGREQRLDFWKKQSEIMGAKRARLDEVEAVAQKRIDELEFWRTQGNVRQDSQDRYNLALAKEEIKAVRTAKSMVGFDLPDRHEGTEELKRRLQALETSRAESSFDDTTAFEKLRLEIYGLKKTIELMEEMDRMDQPTAAN